MWLLAILHEGLFGGPSDRADQFCDSCREESFDIRMQQPATYLSRRQSLAAELRGSAGPACDGGQAHSVRSASDSGMISIAAPLVSVLITAYNREELLPAAIESAPASSLTDIEAIVCDDASTDKTTAIALAIAQKDNRVRVFLNDKNVGDYPNRNRAAGLARGKYRNISIQTIGLIAWSSGDDGLHGPVSRFGSGIVSRARCNRAAAARTHTGRGLRGSIPFRRSFWASTRLGDHTSCCVRGVRGICIRAIYKRPRVVVSNCAQVSGREDSARSCLGEGTLGTGNRIRSIESNGRSRGDSITGAGGVNIVLSTQNR